ncbi:hypothetical protein [Pseudomonas sp.]|uniref:hypothetical protein n=1 Tax=Pseudomonas sp. TaxID=306 RepID=UPI0019E9A10F|nr:hypothetical protein [Pseudomonas sp.]MBF0675572.1 hypothetical protein [Pseudomonas sp.]
MIRRGEPFPLLTQYTGLGSSDLYTRHGPIFQVFALVGIQRPTFDEAFAAEVVIHDPHP